MSHSTNLPEPSKFSESQSSESRSIEQSQKAWEDKTLAQSLKKMTESAPAFHTVSGTPVERLYSPTDSAVKHSQDYLTQLGFPGEYPFTRGIKPTMYRSRLWTMRQYAGFSTAQATNERFRYLLKQGSTGLSVAFDLPTQIGYDSDAPLADGEVGKVGVAIDTLRDMEILFDGIPLNQVSTSMTINATAPILLAMYLVVAEKQGVPANQVSGTIQNDILKEYIARGTYRYPPRPSLRLISDVFAYCMEHAPKWNTISISGYHIREAGSTAAQEIAFTLADAITYLDTAIQAGLNVDDIASRLTFFFACHTDVFEEVAKFRAARRLYAKIMRYRFKAQNPESWKLRFHTQTGGVTLTAQQPDNNIVRVTLQALASVLGGTQSLHTNSRDEALALPTEDSVRIALRTQQILAHESGVTNTVDPLGGSYFVEKMTNDLEAQAEQIIEQIDAMQGMVAAIEAGWVQKQIEQSAYELGQSVERGERIIVGVNKYQTDQDPKTETFKVSDATTQSQINQLQHIRSTRNTGEVELALQAIIQAAKGSDNVMPLILNAVRAYATIGEISEALQSVFGEYQASF